MSPDHWQRLRSLYDIALDHAPSERVQVLSSHAGSDSALIDEVLKLLERDEEAIGFLDVSPAKSLRKELSLNPHLFQPGEIVAQRFKVIRLIGSGGMGEVYEAEDIDLGERIALKTLRMDRLQDPKAHHRLRREALLARKITHPNICRIFDILRHQSGDEEIAVLTMELLDGPTLAHHLAAQGKLTSDDADPIIRQMLAALDAAHRAGVIHRDFKPSNVMLVQGRAVVTDFGLAIGTPDFAGGQSKATTLTQSGQLIGTPEYMAPEQIRNQPATAQSDIYSLGVVIYEMLTGQRPTQGANGLEEILNRVLEAPPSPRLLNPAIPRRWDSIILRCLDRDPARRFQSAGALLHAIDSSWLPIQLPTLSRRAAWVTLAGTVALAATGTGVSLWRDRNLLPVSPLLVLTPLLGEQAQFTSTGLLLRRQLEQSPHLTLWASSSFAEAAQSLRLSHLNLSGLSAEQWRTLTHRVQANFVVHTSLAPIAGEQVLNCRIELIGADSPAVLQQWNQSFRFVSKARSFDAIRDAANWIRSTIGETPASILARDRPPGLITTSSFEALNLFEQAEAIKDERSSEAISLLREAVRLDPDFAIAWMRLGDLQVTMKDWPNGISSWRKAVTLADSGHLSLREADRIRTMYAMEIGDLQAAEAAAVRWSQDFPRELRPLWETFQTRLEMGRVSDAEKMIPRMALLPNNSRFFYLADAVISIWTGDAAKMQNASIRLRTAGAEFQGQKLLSCSYAMKGNYSQAMEEALKLLNLPRVNEVSRGHVYIAALQAAQANFTQARQQLRDGLAHDQSKGLSANEAQKHLSLAYLAWIEKQPEELRAQCILAMQKGDPVTMIPECVALLFRRGFQDLARLSSQRWKSPTDSPRFRRLFQWMTAEQLLSESKFPEALERFRIANNLLSKTWPPEPLLNALFVAGQTLSALELVKNLKSQPASLWYSAEYAPVGTIHQCNHILDAP